MNKIILAVIPIVAIAVILGLAFAGMINIPGVTPKKALKAAAQMYGQKDDKAVSAIPAPQTQVKTEETPPVTPASNKAKETPPAKDPEQGADALATVWNEVDTPELIQITANWKEDELVKVLLHMDGDKVAKYLDEMAKGEPEKKVNANPTRASKLSKILQEQSSIVKPKEKPGETT